MRGALVLESQKGAERMLNVVDANLPCSAVEMPGLRICRRWPDCAGHSSPVFAVVHLGTEQELDSVLDSKLDLLAKAQFVLWQERQRGQEAIEAARRRGSTPIQGESVDGAAIC